MKKLIYTGAFALLAMGFVACSEAESEETTDEEVEMTDEAVTEETTNELNKTLDLQEDAEQLEGDLSEFLETL